MAGTALHINPEQSGTYWLHVCPKCMACLTDLNTHVNTESITRVAVQGNPKDNSRESYVLTGEVSFGLLVQPL